MVANRNQVRVGTELLEAVRRALAAGATSPSELALAVGRSGRSVRQALAELRARGEVVGTSRRPRLASPPARSSSRPPVPARRHVAAPAPTARRAVPAAPPPRSAHAAPARRRAPDAERRAADVPPLLAALSGLASMPLVVAQPPRRQMVEGNSVHAAAYPGGGAARPTAQELEAAQRMGIAAPPPPLVEEPPEPTPEPAARPGLLGTLAYALAGLPGFAPRQSSSAIQRGPR